MTELERAWQEWRALSRRDRAVFLSLLRQDYSQHARQRCGDAAANVAKGDRRDECVTAQG